MSAASEFGVAVIEHRFGPVVAGGLEYDDCVTVAGDQIAYWLHWPDSQAASNPEVGEVWVEAAIDAARYHWEHERGEGDDIAQDSHYDEMTAELCR